MAKEENEFQKLLGEAPMAPSADTVTVVGALSRTADPTRFVLTLPTGQSETLEVAAVKSAKKIAGAIGQSLVELELDAKKISERVRDIVISGKHAPTDPITWAEYDATPASQDTAGTGIADHHVTIAQTDTIAETIGTLRETIEPFAAAMPHQAASHRALHVLKPPQLDPQVPPKQPGQDGTNPWNSFDITGLGGFDVITYHNGQPIYHY
jgi:hypothetical protein